MRNDAHRDEPVRAETAQDRGERVQEDDLDVEDDERHRDQIELHREALDRLVLGNDAALVRRLLGRRRPPRPEQLDAANESETKSTTSTIIARIGRYCATNVPSWSLRFTVPLVRARFRFAL